MDRCCPNDAALAASLQSQLDQVIATIQAWSATLADLSAKVDALNTRVGALDGVLAHSTPALDFPAYTDARPLTPVAKFTWTEVNVIAHQYNCVGTYVGHGGPVWCLAIGPDNLIFSGSADQRIRVR